MPDIILKCEVSGEEFNVTEWEQKFLEKMDFPLPRLCKKESHRRRLAYRNERTIYRGKCDKCNKSIISIYSPDKKFTVYCQDCWWSDSWDARDYGRDFDFSRGFFEQFKELQAAVPRMSLLNTKAENSEYCNITTGNKNCYLVFGGDVNEDCMYSVFCFDSRDCSDLYWSGKCELCYECVDCEQCYSCRYCQYVYNSHDCAFSYDLRGCKNCFGCIGLQNQEYCFFNEKLSKEEYEKRLAEYDLGSNTGVERAKKDFEEFRKDKELRKEWIISSENCSGNNISNAKNVSKSFDVFGPAEDLSEVLLCWRDVKDIYRSDHFGHKLEMAYEVLGSITGLNYAFCTFVWNSSDITYCDFVVNNSHDCFGCTNMKKASYCILNKQYSKEEYDEMMNKIIDHMEERGEWGEFFPIENSPFAYNETIANDFAPLSKEEALSKGLKWLDEEVKAVGSGDEVPDSINEVDESILNKVFVCKETGRPYKVNKEELKFYKKLKIPVPHFAPETRNQHRIALRAKWN